MNEIVAFSATVHGTVQGVWFRKSTREQATALGVGGFVCNRPDGTVYLEAEGPEPAVQQLLAWCRLGPELAVVTQVNSTPIAPRGVRHFEIRYNP